MFRRSFSSDDTGSGAYTQRRPTQRVRSSIAPGVSQPEPPPPPPEEDKLKRPVLRRKSSILIKERAREEKFWWPKSKKPPCKRASWSVAIFTERHDILNAWPAKPWGIAPLSEDMYETRTICKCIPIRRKVSFIEEEVVDPTGNRRTVRASTYLRHRPRRNTGSFLL